MQPIAPRFSTMVAADSARIVFSALRQSSAPEAIMISSSVPTIRSQSGSTDFINAETRSDFT